MKDVKVSGRGHCGGILFACGLVVTVTKSLFQAQNFFFFKSGFGFSQTNASRNDVFTADK